MIYKFRVTFDSKKDEEEVYREIEIGDYENLEEFHKAIISAFGLSGKEFGAFYKSDVAWNQGEEYNMMDEESEAYMANVYLSDVVSKKEKNMIYVYDLMNMYTFLVELKRVSKEKEEEEYPRVTSRYGILREEIQKGADLDEISSEFANFEFDQDEFNQQYGYGGGLDYDGEYNEGDLDGLHIEGEDGEDYGYYGGDEYGYEDEY